MVQAMVNAFRGRQRARKAVMQAVLAQGLHAEMMVPVVAFIARQGRSSAPRRSRSLPR